MLIYHANKNENILKNHRQKHRREHSMRARVLAAFTKSALGSNSNYRIFEAEGTEYIVIPGNAYDYQLSILAGFLRLFTDTIMQPENSDFIIISMTDAELIADYLEKNSQAWKRFEKFINIVSEIINRSSYLCEEYFLKDTKVYRFTHEAGAALVKAIAPDEIIISSEGKEIILDLRKFIHLSANDIETVMNNCERLLSATTREAEITHRFISLLPQFNIVGAAPSRRVDGQICIRPDFIQRAFLKPVLELVQSTYQTDCVLIESKQLLTAECQKELTNRLKTTNKYSVAMTAYIRAMIALEGIAFAENETTCSFGFTAENTCKIVAGIHNTIGIKIEADKYSITISYEDIIHLPNKKISLLENDLSKHPELIYLKGENLEVAIRTAIMADDVESFITLVGKDKKLIEKPFEFNEWAGCTLVAVAAIAGSDNILSYLIDQKTNVTEPMGCGKSNGLTPLACAVMTGKFGSVKLLAKVDDINRPLTKAPFKGRRPVFFAIATGDDEMVRLLLSINADVFSPSKEPSGITPLETAIVNLRPQVVRTLLDAGVNHAATGAYSDLCKLAITRASDAGQKEIGDTIVEMLQNETPRMGEMLKVLSESFLTNSPTNTYRWVAAPNGVCVLMIPTEDPYWQFALPFLNALGIKTMSHTSRDGFKSIGILKHFATILTDTLTKDPGAWKSFRAILNNIEKAQGSLPTQRRLIINNDGAHIECTDGTNILCPELTALCISAHEDSMFTLTSKRILKLSENERKTLLTGLIRATVANNTRKETLTRFYELLMGMCGNFKCSTSDTHFAMHEISARHLAILSDLFNSLNAVEVDRSYNIAFNDILNNKDWEKLLDVAARNVKKLDAFVSLSARFGTRDKSYNKNTVVFKFAKQADADNFRTVAKILDKKMSCTYADIFGLDIALLTAETNELFNKAKRNELMRTRLTLLKQALIKFEITENAWIDESNLCSKASIKWPFQQIVRLLGNSICTIHEEPLHLTVDTEKLTDLNENDLKETQFLISKSADNLAIALSLIQLISLSWKFTDKGIQFDFKNDDLKSYFKRTCLELSASSLDDTNTCVFAFSKLLEIRTEDLKIFRRSLYETIRDANKPKVVVVDDDKPVRLAKPPKPANNGGGKKNGNKPATNKSNSDKNKAKKPNSGKQKSGKSKNEKTRQPSCPAQDRPYLTGKEPKVVEAKYYSGAGANHAAADECVRQEAVVEEVVERLPITEGSIHDNAIQQELLWLQTVHEWAEASFKTSNHGITLKILNAVTHVCLIRLMNAIYLRKLEDRGHVQFSDNEDRKAGKIRANLFHHSPNAEEVENFYQALKIDGINRILDKILHNESVKSEDKLPFRKYSQTFFSKKEIEDYTPRAQKTFEDLAELLDHYEHLDPNTLDAALTVRALQDCIYELGELTPHLNKIYGYSPALIEAIEICRVPRNQSSHNTGKEALNFDTLSTEKILKLTRLARDTWKEWLLQQKPSLSQPNC